MTDVGDDDDLLRAAVAAYAAAYADGKPAPPPLVAVACAARGLMASHACTVAEAVGEACHQIGGGEAAGLELWEWFWGHVQADIETSGGE